MKYDETFSFVTTADQNWLLNLCANISTTYKFSSDLTKFGKSSGSVFYKSANGCWIDDFKTYVTTATSATPPGLNQTFPVSSSTDFITYLRSFMSDNANGKHHLKEGSIGLINNRMLFMSVEFGFDNKAKKVN